MLRKLWKFFIFLPILLCYVSGVESNPSRRNKNNNHDESQTICLTADKGDCIVSPSGNVLIYGGSGIFGSFLVDFFHEHHYFVTNVDFKKNEDADLNVLIHGNLTFEQQAYIVANAVPDNVRFNAIICTKSGWTDKEGTLGSRDFLKNAQQILKENLWSSLIAANLAPGYLTENGVLILMGGQLALKPMPTMIAYSVAKAAVHQLARSVGASGSGLPRGAKAYAILPASLSKGQKKKFSPKDVWNPLKDLAREDWLFYTILTFFSIGFIYFWRIVARIVYDIKHDR